MNKQTVALTAALTLAHAGLLYAQAAPPVLSTMPTPSPGAASTPAEMSGLPLQVGDLPPGVVVVRVIRRSFDENVANQAVELYRADGRIVTRATGADGRARFDGLNVGETVHTRAVVDTEFLDSQRFEVPARGGVRLVLVGGVGAGMPADGAHLAPGSAAPLAASVANPGGNGLAIPLACTFVFAAGAFVWFVKRPRGASALVARRQRLIAELDEIERTMDANR